MKRPIIYVMFYYIFGLLAGRYLTFTLGIVLFLVFMSFIEFLIMKFSKLKMFFILSLVSLLGVFVSSISGSNISITTEKFCNDKVEVDIYGIIDDIYISRNGYTIIDLKTDTIKYQNKEDNNNLKISVVYENKVEASVGMSLKVTGILEKGDNSGFLGMFSERNYMLSNDIDYSVYAEDVAITSRNIEKSLNYYIWEMRKLVNSKIDIILPLREGGILKAMITGDKNYIDDYYTNIFKKAGVSHILAVSGLHMSIISGFIYTILSKILGLPRKISSLLSIPFVIMFAVFCGLAPSVVRASIMSTIVFISNIIDEESDILNSVAIACILILLVSPNSIYSIGFQLSFLATAGVGGGIELSNRFKRINPVVKSILFVSLGANIMTLPLCMYYFYGISVASIFVNIIIVPVTGYVVIMGIISVILSFISVSFGLFTAGSVFVLINFIEKVSLIAENNKYMYIETGSISLYAVIFFYLAIFTAFALINFKRATYISLVFALMFGISLNFDYISKRNKLAFLNVGNGSSAVYTTYDGFTAVIDGGGHFMDIGNNTGIKYVIPYLEYEGCKCIDMLFISNMNMENCKGAIEIIENFDVKNVFIPEYKFSNSGIYIRLLDSISERDIPLYTVNSNDVINVTDDINFQVMHPNKDKQIYDGNENHSSLVLKLNDRENSILFTSNLDSKDLDIMILNNLDLSSDILKIYNSGDNVDLNENLIKNVLPKYFIISSKEDTSNKMKDILDKYVIKYYNTSVNKSIKVELYEDFYKIRPVIETE